MEFHLGLASCPIGNVDGESGSGSLIYVNVQDLPPDVAERLRSAEQVLVHAGADFAYVFGSQARGEATDRSDVDIAVHFPGDAPAAFELDVPSGIDLLVLNDAPLAIKGRVATGGVLLFQKDESAQVHWLAMTRKIYFDEKYRMDHAAQDFAAAVKRGR